MTQYTASGYTHSLLECENTFLRACIDEQERIITSYQIAKDNLELRLAKAMGAVRGSGIQGIDDGVVILGRGTGPTFYRPVQVY